MKKRKRIYVDSVYCCQLRLSLFLYIMVNLDMKWNSADVKTKKSVVCMVR